VLPELTRRAVAYIADRAPAARAGTPFFLYFPLTAPHAPIVPVGRWKHPHPLGNYGGLVEELDDTVGQVLAALDAQGLAEQTLVIVTSDNGFAPYVGIVEGDDRGHGKGDVHALEALGHFPSATYRGYKSELWEGGHRVPFLARWPGTVAPGTVCNGLVGLNDVMATVAELTRHPLPDNAGEDSVSFLGLLHGQEKGRDTLILHSLNGRFTIREGQWKLLAWSGSGGYGDPAARKKAVGTNASAVQLYDLGTDPAETHNLAAEQPDRVTALRSLLQRQVDAGRSTPGQPQTNDVPVLVDKP
jgi:arylsulfatase A-like enzyme